MDVQVSVQVSAFNPFGHMPRNGLAGLYGNPVWLFKELPYRLPQRLHHLQAEHTLSVFPPRHRLAKSHLCPVREGMHSRGREKNRSGVNISLRRSLFLRIIPPNVAVSFAPTWTSPLAASLLGSLALSTLFIHLFSFPPLKPLSLDIIQEYKAYPSLGVGEWSVSKEMRLTGSHAGATVKGAGERGRRRGWKWGFGWTEPPDKGTWN